MGQRNRRGPTHHPSRADRTRAHYPDNIVPGTGTDHPDDIRGARAHTPARHSRGINRLRCFEQ
ncbi:hypothetical protein Ntsu_68020 [Nocardia sp. IFM 10818]